MSEICRGSGHGQVRRFGVGESCEHVADAAKIDVWNRDSHEYGGEQQQNVFNDAGPRYAAYSTDKNEAGDQPKRYHHGGGSMDRSETGDLHDESESRELKLQIWNQKNDAHQSATNAVRYVLPYRV